MLFANHIKVWQRRKIRKDIGMPSLRIEKNTGYGKRFAKRICGVICEFQKSAFYKKTIANHSAAASCESFFWDAGCTSFWRAASNYSKAAPKAEKVISFIANTQVDDVCE